MKKLLDHLYLLLVHRGSGPPSPQMIVRPADASHCALNPPPLTWPAVKGATAYRVLISRDEDPGHSDPIIGETRRNFYLHPAALPPGRWFWVVEARGRLKRILHRSPVRSFLVEQETAVLPLPDPLRLADRVPPHPRLFLGSEYRDWRRKARGGSDPDWVLFLEQVDQTLGAPLEPEPSYRLRPGDTWYEHIHQKINLPTFRQTHRMLRCAFAGLVTEDDKYTLEAVRLAGHLAAWDLDGATGMRNADQSFREITLALSIVFDWAHPAFSEPQRRDLADAIGRRGEILHGVLGDRFLKNPYMSHEVTCLNFLLMISCATLGDIPRARDWFNYTLPAYFSFMPVWGGDDGGISQGLHYLRLVSYPTLLAADAVNSVTSFPIFEKPWLKNVGDFFLYFLPPNLQKRYFGKSGLPERPARVEKRIMEHLAAVYSCDHLKWYAEETVDDGRDSYGSIGGGLEAFLWPPAPVVAAPPTSLPGARLFADVGWVSMHSKLGDDDDIMLAFKSSPYGSYSHSQADQNSLVVYAGGRPLLIDSGYSNEEGDHKARYAVQTRAHNCILVDNEGQRTHDWTAQGRIVDFVQRDWISYTCGDASNAYDEKVVKALRHVLHLTPNCFIVADEIASRDETTFQLLWHALAPFQRDLTENGRGLRYGTANGPWRAELQTSATTKIRADQGNDWGGIPPHELPQEEIHEEWQLTLTTEEHSRTVGFLTVIDIHHDGEPDLTITPLESEGGLAMEIVKGPMKAIIGWKDPDAETAACRDIITDAALFLLQVSGDRQWDGLIKNGTWFQAEATGRLNLDPESVQIIKSTDHLL